MRGYRLPTGADSISPFEAVFGVHARYSDGPAEVKYVASDAALVHEFEVAAMKAARAS